MAELAEQTEGDDDNIRVYTEELQVLETALQVVSSEEVLTGTGSGGNSTDVYENYLCHLGDDPCDDRYKNNLSTSGTL